MRNIQIIDGAQNCVFSVFQASDCDFAILFPEAGQDVQLPKTFPISVILPKPLKPSNDYETADS